MARRKSEFGPNLGSILQGAPAALVRQFLASFKRPDDTLLAPPEITEGTTDDQGKAALSAYLRSEDKEIIGLLEGIAGALLDMGQDKGATSLETVAGQRLQNVDYDQYESQPDLLCKSIWMRTVFPMHFHDAQSFYAARRYRERRTYYTCCEVDFDHASVADTDGIPDEKLCDAVQEALGLKGKVTASVLELPETANYPPSFMVALRHPGPLSSIDNHREEGGWTVHYYRPSHEAVLIYTPQLKKIEVASASSDVREKTSKVFSNVLQHFSLRHLQQIHAIPKARWGECAGKLALPFALTGTIWTPVSSEGPAGVHPEGVSGSFLAIFVCWRAWLGMSPATGPDFWEATPAGIHRATRNNHAITNT